MEADARGEFMPIVVGGGPCTYNAEPVADFFDIFSIGEGEEALPELMRLYVDMSRTAAIRALISCTARHSSKAFMCRRCMYPNTIPTARSRQ